MSENGLLLPCPCCGEMEAEILLSLASPDTFTCQACNEEFDREFLDAFLARWARVLAWVDAMPRQAEVNGEE